SAWYIFNSATARRRGETWVARVVRVGGQSSIRPRLDAVERRGGWRSGGSCPGSLQVGHGSTPWRAGGAPRRPDRAAALGDSATARRRGETRRSAWPSRSPRPRFNSATARRRGETQQRTVALPPPVKASIRPRLDAVERRHTGGNSPTSLAGFNSATARRRGE